MQNHPPTGDQVRSRAYDVYLARGCQHGHDQDDWLQAEYELLRLPVRRIAALHARQSKPGLVNHSSLVALVQTALLLAAEALPHLRG